MKKSILTICVLLSIAVASCSKSNSVKHESPKFLTVVDSICDKYKTENGYDATEVKKGFHKYMSYYGASAPIFKDLPLNVTDTLSSITLDGKSKYVTAFMNYMYEEPTDNGKLLYAIHVQVENVIDVNEPTPFKKGETYFISSKDGGLIQYDGTLDLIGMNEVVDGNGKIVDGRSFGTIKIKDATFTQAK